MRNISAQPIRIGEKCSVKSVLRVSSPRMELVVIINKIIAAMDVVASSSKILRAITESVKRLAASWTAYYQKHSPWPALHMRGSFRELVAALCKAKFQQAPRNVGPQACSPKRVVVECDRAVVFCRKRRKQWILIAMTVRVASLSPSVHIKKYENLKSFEIFFDFRESQAFFL